MLTHLEPQAPKKGKKREEHKHRKTREFLRSFWRGGEVGGRGCGPSLPTERRESASLLRRGEKRLRLCHGQGPLAGFKGCRPIAGQGPNYVAHFVAMLAYVGLCWSILRAMWAHLVAMLAYVGLRLIHVEPKDPKNGNSKKNTVKRRIFDGRRPILGLCWPILGLCWPILRAMWAYLGAMLAHLGAMLAHLGAMLAHLGAMLGPSWGYVGPS